MRAKKLECSEGNKIPVTTKAQQKPEDVDGAENAKGESGIYRDFCENLPLPERLELLDALWESIVEEGYEPPLTSAQADELDRRLKAHQRNPDDVVDWKAIKTELDSKLGRD